MSLVDRIHEGYDVEQVEKPRNGGLVGVLDDYIETATDTPKYLPHMPGYGNGHGGGRCTSYEVTPGGHPTGRGMVGRLGDRYGATPVEKIEEYRLLCSTEATIS